MRALGLKYSLIIVALTLFQDLVAQAQTCSVKIIRLAFDKNAPSFSPNLTTAILGTAKPTGDILVHDAEIIKFANVTETVSFSYAGESRLRSHEYTLDSTAVSRLANLDIPAFCGIPVAIYFNDKEQYRALLLNPFTLFDSGCISAYMINITLKIVTKIPAVTFDFSHMMLWKKGEEMKCLSGR